MLPFQYVTKMGIHYEEYKLHMKNYIDRQWQGRLDVWTENKLNKVQALLGDRRLLGHLSRQDKRVLSHVCIGYTHITHSYLLNGQHVPRCVACDSDPTVEHILIKCGNGS